MSYLYNGIYYPTYLSYCKVYWSDRNHPNPIIIVKHYYNINILCIDTTAPMNCLYGIGHPFSPRPTRFPQFLYTCTYPLLFTPRMYDYLYNIYLPRNQHMTVRKLRRIYNMYRK